MGKIMTAQTNLIALLEADPFFADPDPNKVVTVVSKRVGDIDAAINEKLAEIGVGLIVIMRQATLPENDTPELALDVQFALTAVENVVANDTGKTSEDIAEKAATLIHFKPNGVSVGDVSVPGRFLVDHNAIAPRPPPPKQLAVNVQVLLVSTTITLN